MGEEPFCSKCGYSLQALSSERCPECGADVGRASGVVSGRRVRSRGPLGTGALLSISAAVCLGGSGWKWARSFDWYTLKPTGYVLDDLAATSSPNRLRALREMQRRTRSGASLAPRHHARMVDLALAEQATVAPPVGSFPFWTVPNMTWEMVTWLTDEAQAGRLNAAQRATLCEQTQPFALIIRPTIVAGDPVPYRLFRQIPLYNLDVRIIGMSVTEDGKPAPGGSAALPIPEFQEPLSSDGAWSATTVGTHTYAAKLRVEVWTRAAPSRGIRESLLHTFDLVQTATAQVIERDAVKRPSEVPGAEAGFRAVFRTGFFNLRDNLGSGGRQITGTLGVVRPPADLMFSVSARINGKEYPMAGRVQCAAGQSVGVSLAAPYDGPADVAKIELILRPDEAGARRTIDLLNIWDRELVVKDVMMFPVR